jgi:spermidine synthase
MYHVIGTGITIVVLYFISYFFYRSNIYSLQLHRRLWNYILASAFFLTALAGLMLALQITYKWDIPVIKTILKWHVEIGIGLTVTGLFHFLWHSSYYFNPSESEERKNPPADSKVLDSGSGIAANLFITGFISSSVQLLLLREIMNITCGYELVAGAFLCSWLIGSAAGSALAPRSSLTDRGRINLYFAVGPLVSIMLMLLFSRLFLNPGETPSFLTGIVFTALVLIPFCLISGFTFIKLIAAGKTVSLIPGKSFSIETAGGIGAGIIISLLSNGILNTYQSLLLIITLGISYVVLTFYIVRKSQKLAFKTIASIVSVLIIIFSPDIIFRQFLLRGVKVTDTVDTPYGNITRGEYHNESSTYYNQRLLIYSNDAVESEEDIHYPMLQTVAPENVLLISGPVGSRLHEIIKYKVQKVIYVERDPAIAKIDSPENTDRSEVLQIENGDAFGFVRKTTEKFDAVIMLLPPPSSLSLNRYYTLEFFLSIKSRMNKDGVFSCSPGINPNYFNEESVRLYSSVFNSLKEVFKNVVPVSGNKLYFIASDKELSTSICQLARDKNINNIYVGPDYLSDDLLSSKSAEIISLIDPDIRKNRATMPIASFYYQSLNISKNLNEKIPSIVLIIVLFALSLRTLRAENGIMYFSALALAGFEIILLLILQLTIGNMYQMTGLILAGLMTGLAVGSGNRLPVFETRPPGIKVFLLITFYLLSGLAAKKVMTINAPVAVAGLLIISGFIPAVITGSFFRDLTSGKILNSDPSSVYSADLAGSAIGFIVFSGVSVPLLGISNSLFILPILIFAGFLYAAIRNKR